MLMHRYQTPPVTAELSAALAALWAMLTALFATDWQLVMLTVLIVAANSVVRAIVIAGKGLLGRIWAGFWEFFKTVSAYIVFLAFAQAGANKFELLGWLDTFSYLTAYVVEFTRLGRGLAGINPQVDRAITQVDKVISSYFKHTSDELERKNETP